MQGIGLRLRAIARSDGAGAIGPFDLEVVVKPPTAAGFSITSPAVNGGGVIGYDPLIGRYFGVISLDVVAVGLSAMVVVDTRLPGDPDGYALFASIFAEFPSLPLGFGFFLSGVGGLLCLNRGMDGEAIAAGLHDGAIDALLFPENVLEDATFILGQLDNWFPIAPGSTAIGLAAAIDWGTPEPIITGELGIVVSLPEGEIAVLGSVSMALPESDPLLSLHMDTLGLIDPSTASVMVVASLYDSSLLGTIMLSGDMATYAVFSGQPYFLMSVGGYHPGFCPPVPLPPAVADLRPFGFEVALADDVWFRLESYVAIASNAFQFGSLAVLEASTKFLLTTYTARGEVGFDVLLTVKPFSFIADAHVLVSVTAGGADLIHAELRVHLSGPKPWLATGFGEFEFLGIDVRFDFSVGGMPSVTAPPREPVHEQVTTALSDDRACERVATADNGVLAGSGDPQDGVAVRPDGSLRIVQTVAPLDRRIEVFGQCGVEGPDLLSVDDAGIDGVDSATWSPVLDYFAPAMFDEMTDAEKLSSPSYELMTAGVALSVPGISIGSMTAAVTPEPEVFVLTARTRALGLGAALNSTVTDLFSRTATRLTGPRPAPTVSATRFTVNSPGWAQIDPESGVAESPPTAYHDALSALRRRRLVDPAARITPDPGARRTT